MTEQNGWSWITARAFMDMALPEQDTRATVEITYYPGQDDERTATVVLYDPTEAVRWIVSSLAGWCVDEDVRVMLNGDIIWGN